MQSGKMISTNLFHYVHFIPYYFRIRENQEGTLLLRLKIKLNQAVASGAPFPLLTTTSVCVKMVHFRTQIRTLFTKQLNIFRAAERKCGARGKIFSFGCMTSYFVNLWEAREA